jgi:hypothetical protein
MTISGQAPAGSKLDALIFYVPDARANSANSPQCQFEEDLYSVNGNNKFAQVKTVADASGNYSITLSENGKRKNCVYTPDKIMLTIEKGQVYEPIDIISAAEAKSLSDGTEGTVITPELKSEQSIACDFSADSVGTCSGTALGFATHFVDQKVIINFVQQPSDSAIIEQ